MECMHVCNTIVVCSNTMLVCMYHCMMYPCMCMLLCIIVTIVWIKRHYNKCAGIDWTKEDLVVVKSTKNPPHLIRLVDTPPLSIPVYCHCNYSLTSSLFLLSDLSHLPHQAPAVSLLVANQSPVDISWTRESLIWHHIASMLLSPGLLYHRILTSSLSVLSIRHLPQSEIHQLVQ